MSAYIFWYVYAWGWQMLSNNYAVYSGSAIITPAQPVFMEIFSVNAEVSSLVLSMYVLGYVGCHKTCARESTDIF